jgi:hypothetical protein
MIPFGRLSTFCRVILNHFFIKKIAPGIFLAALASPSYCHYNWTGIFLPDYGQCEGLNLIVYPTSVTYGNCKKVKIRVLVRSEDEFVFQVSDSPKCSLSGAVFTLQRGSTGNVVLGKYDNLSNYQTQIPTYFCPYKK